MKEHFAYDRVLKDLFQTDHPTLLETLTGGVRVREFLNVEFQQVMERRADLVALLDDDTIFHFEFQGQNVDDMAYRAGIYGLMISHKHRKPVFQTVLYVGIAPMQMPSHLDTGGGITVWFRLLDIREIDSATLMKSNSPGDLALAMLAKGGTEQLGEIARRAAQLSGKARVRVLTQLILLSGLRKISGKLRMEMKSMGSLQIDFRENEILRDVWEEVMAESAHETAYNILRGMLEAKFQSIPDWAEVRMNAATFAQLDRWCLRLVAAESITAVFEKE